MPKAPLSTTASRQARKKAPKTKLYAVLRGRQPGIYETWAEAEKQVNNFPGALHKSFPTASLARAYMGWPDGSATSSSTSAPLPPPSTITRAPDHTREVKCPKVEVSDDDIVIDDRHLARSASTRTIGHDQPPVIDLSLHSDDGDSDIEIINPSSARHAPLRRALSPSAFRARPRDALPEDAGPSFWHNDDSVRRDSLSCPFPHLVPTAEESPHMLHLAGRPRVEVHPLSSTSTDPSLSPQQQQILTQILEGKNFFFTGPAGTGKSVLLRAIVRAFRERSAAEQAVGMRKLLEESTTRKNGEDVAHGSGGMTGADEKVANDDDVKPATRWHLAVCASTGIAAVNIGGVTLHSWAAIGLGQADWQKLAGYIKRDRSLVARWQTTAALLIDEISMIDGQLLDKINLIAQDIRHDHRPFGGLQIIASGDFFQLPPVPNTDPKNPSKKLPVRMAFEADCWDETFEPQHMAELDRVFRQDDDMFVRLLSEMRQGAVKPATSRLLQALNRPVVATDGIEPIALFPVNKAVELRNSERLSQLVGKSVSYDARDMPGVDSLGDRVTWGAAVKMLNESTTWPQHSEFKVGAQVMLLVNVSVQQGLANGATGKIVDFQRVGDAVAAGCFVPAKYDPSVAPDNVKYPVVEFLPAKYAQEPMPKRVIVPDLEVTVENADGAVAATRTMVPLKLAWALTIHKSQGQTLERVSIDLSRIFEQGQTYVALSRATSLEGMRVIGFTDKKVMVNPKVIEWSRKMKTGGQSAEAR